MAKAIQENDFSFPAVMGILNVTPDSFFDGGRHNTQDLAIRHAVTMSQQGAAWIDIGGESTRPGSDLISVSEELDRVLPIVESVTREVDTPVSIDTNKPEVMLEAIKSGATFINDVYALRRTGATEVAAQHDVKVCLTHMQGEPKTMQDSYHYFDVVNDVKSWLEKRISECVDSGIDKENIIIDPGFGFGKSDYHNMQLVNGIEKFNELGVPVLLGVSRKSTIGRLLDRELKDRMPGSLALAVIAALKKVSILRVHDVKETLDAIRIVKIMQEL